MKSMGGLKNVHRMPKLSEYDDFMTGFIDDKIKSQARMTSQLRSTLKSLENTHGVSRSIILESDEEGEDN